MASIIRRQLNATGESSGFRTPYYGGGNDHSLVGPCAESDTAALADISEANALSVEIQNNVPQIDAITDVAERAEDAGAVFLASADTIEAGGDVSEAAIAQADAIAADVADEVGVSAEELTGIPNSERDSITGESGKHFFKPAYQRVRRDPVQLRMAGESMMDKAKELGSKAIDAVIKIYEKFCQWVGKYIGTFPRLLKNAESIKKQASEMAGKRMENSTLTLTGGTAKQFTFGGDQGAVTPKYLTNHADLNTAIKSLRSLTEEFVAGERKEDGNFAEIIEKFDDIDFSNGASIKTFYKAIFDNFITYGSGNATSNIGNKLFKGTDPKPEVHHKLALPAYKNYIIVGPNNNDYANANALSTVFDPLTGNNASGGTAITSTSGSTLIPDAQKLISHLEKCGHKVINGDPDNKQSLKTDITFKTLSAAQVEDNCNELINLLEEYVSYRNSKNYLKNLQSLRKLKNSGDKLQKNAERENANRANDPANAIPDKLRIVTKLATMLAKKKVNGAEELKKLVEGLTTFYNAVLSVCKQSLSAHKAND